MDGHDCINEEWNELTGVSSFHPGVLDYVDVFSRLG